ncbi:MAG: MerR family transcriptional regulator [Gemmatimonadota bacterium]|nr:MerR family transcriptional regulator [Gemmatimonadota bacterium]
MPNDYPDKEYYSISEVCRITKLKSHVLRYWESQFKILSPAKNRAGNRAYRKSDIQVVQLIKHLLYIEKYTIEGAQKKLKLLKNMGESVEDAMPGEDKNKQILSSIRRELADLKQLLSH